MTIAIAMLGSLLLCCICKVCSSHPSQIPLNARKKQDVRKEHVAVSAENTFAMDLTVAEGEIDVNAIEYDFTNKVVIIKKV